MAMGGTAILPVMAVGGAVVGTAAAVGYAGYRLNKYFKGKKGGGGKGAVAAGLRGAGKNPEDNKEGDSSEDKTKPEGEREGAGAGESANESNDASGEGKKEGEKGRRGEREKEAVSDESEVPSVPFEDADEHPTTSLALPD